MKTGTCYIQYEPNSTSSGYCDCYVELSDGSQLFVNRITQARNGAISGYYSGGTLVQWPNSLVCVCTGFTTAVKIWFKPQKGLMSLNGIGWKTEDRDIYDASWVHSDNIVGNPSSLSDERIKDNVSHLDPSNCLNFCNAINPSIYLQTLANEVRTGLIAQEVQSDLTSHSFPTDQILDTKMTSVVGQSEELLALMYERFVPHLLAAVKALTLRIEELESK